MEQRNLIAAIVLSVVILLGFNLFYERPRMEQEQARQEAAQQEAERQAQLGGTAAAPELGAPRAPGAATAPPAAAPSREAVIGATERVRIGSARLHGSVALRGARLDDLTLADYRETIEPDSDEITLLSPPDAPQPYYAKFGWVPGPASTGVAVPGPNTVWTADRLTLAPGKPVTLRWKNESGLDFSQTVALDKNYMFTVTQRVRNGGDRAVSLHPYGLVSRTGTPDVFGFFILHEGLFGVFDEKLSEVDYDDLQEEERGEVEELCRTDARFRELPAAGHAPEKGTIERCSTGGWIGITDKFWLVALIPDQKAAVGSTFKHRLENAKDRYQIDILGAAMSVPAGAVIESTSRLFAGAKEVKLLDSYRDELGISRFDLAVDWGWLWFLTKPIFQALLYFRDFLGNFGLAILLLTVLIKLAFFPLANKSYKAMSRMKKLQPKMTEIREKYKDDRTRQNQEMMALYKNENANPAAGCFPIVIQIPVFFALYKVLFVTIEMRHAPFFGWIHDLSAPDPLGLLTAFGLIQWDIPPMLAIANIGIWPIVMGLTMYLQQKLNPQPADPTQAKIMMMLPLVFTFMLGRFPAGLVIYWAWNNTLSIAQQWVIMRRMGVSASGGSTGGPSPGAATAKPAAKAKPTAKAKAKAKPAPDAKAKAKAKPAPEAKAKAKAKAKPAPEAKTKGKAKGKRGKKRAN